MTAAAVLTEEAPLETGEIPPSAEETPHEIEGTPHETKEAIHKKEDPPETMIMVVATLSLGEAAPVIVMLPPPAEMTHLIVTMTDPTQANTDPRLRDPDMAHPGTAPLHQALGIRGMTTDIREERDMSREETDPGIQANNTDPPEMSLTKSWIISGLK